MRLRRLLRPSNDKIYTIVVYYTEHTLSASYTFIIRTQLDKPGRLLKSSTTACGTMSALEPSQDRRNINAICSLRRKIVDGTFGH